MELPARRSEQHREMAQALGISQAERVAMEGDRPVLALATEGCLRAPPPRPHRHSRQPRACTRYPQTFLVDAWGELSCDLLWGFGGRADRQARVSDAPLGSSARQTRTRSRPEEPRNELDLVLRGLPTGFCESVVAAPGIVRGVGVFSFD